MTLAGRYRYDDAVSLHEFPDDPAFPKVALRLDELIQWITSGHEPKGTVTFADGATITSAELAGWIAWWAARAELGLADSVGGAEFGAALHRKLHEASGGAVMAQLYFTWEELELLAGLVDRRIEGMPLTDAEWGKLNSLRTALREAQYGLRR